MPGGPFHPPVAGKRRKKTVAGRRVNEDAKNSLVDLGELSAPMHKRLKFWECITGLLKMVNNVDLCTLQADMNALCKWADLWQLSISVDKCCVLSVGKVDPIVDIFLSGTALPHVTSCRDLGGVTVS